jgi:hypothetical protein
MRCPTCCGGAPESPCVCATEAELADAPDYPMDERLLFAPRDIRDEYRHPEDFTPPEWAERYES